MRSFKYILVVCFLFAVGFNPIYAGESMVEDKPSKEFKLYPNPVEGDYFVIDTDESIIEVKVLNLLGQQVYQQHYNNTQTARIEFENNEKGLYLVQIKTNDNRVTTKRILFK